MTQPLHKSQHKKNLGHIRIAYKPRHAHARTHTHLNIRSQKKHGWQLLTQLFTNHNTQRGQNNKTQWHTNNLIFSIFFQFSLFLRHQMMDKVQKHNSFNTNIPSSESYRNDQWRALVNTVMNFRVPYKAENFLTGWLNISFSRRTLLHKVNQVGSQL
jgi:hypothetical protein